MQRKIKKLKGSFELLLTGSSSCLPWMPKIKKQKTKKRVFESCIICEWMSERLTIQKWE